MQTSDKNNNGEPPVVILLVKVAAKTESQQRAQDALLADVQGARTEEGNINMELYRAGNDPEAFYLFERWQNQSALENHFRQPYTQQGCSV
jgi:quinol monooxygenase YgiN